VPPDANGFSNQFVPLQVPIGTARTKCSRAHLPVSLVVGQSDRSLPRRVVEIPQSRETVGEERRERHRFFRARNGDLSEGLNPLLNKSVVNALRQRLHWH
jgi:hypothetical protein